MKEECGCCEGIEKLTPLPTANRPGLNALGYRVGTHATFLETMLARLSTHYLEIPLDEIDEHGKQKTTRVYPLQRLKTRLREDPAIALLDAWATVADVLTFYQERIANEGYLRTATERRSILELARLVGYKLRPGVASSVYLAYTLDENSKDEVVVPNGARSQSVPGPAELPQSFETSEDLKARAKWNNLKPRMTQPQTAALITGDSNGPRVYVKGINTNLTPNDPLLIDFGDGSEVPSREGNQAGCGGRSDVGRVYKQSLMGLKLRRRGAVSARKTSGELGQGANLARFGSTRQFAAPGAQSRRSILRQSRSGLRCGERFCADAA